MEYIEDPELYPHTYGQLIFDKEAKTIQWNKRKNFQQMVLDQLVVHLGELAGLEEMREIVNP